MLRAISFGVFWRSAPSMSAIIRSMKEWPGREVTRTTIRSESTVVPPVTPERSPPASRITGADSPVTADSSTEATPATTSPSAGISSPASTRTKSNCLRSVAATASVAARSTSVPYRQCVSRSATVSVRALRSDSACARPRPSATASARFAKTTVSQSQTLTVQVNTDGSNNAESVVSTEPTATTKSTGFRTRVRGWSLRSASGNDFTSCTGSRSPPWPARRRPGRKRGAGLRGGAGGGPGKRGPSEDGEPAGTYGPAGGCAGRGAAECIAEGLREDPGRPCGGGRGETAGPLPGGSPGGVDGPARACGCRAVWTRHPWCGCGRTARSRRGGTKRRMGGRSVPPRPGRSGH